MSAYSIISVANMQVKELLLIRKSMTETLSGSNKLMVIMLVCVCISPLARPH